MYKYLFFCRKLKKTQEKVFHTKKVKKRDEMDVCTKLSTLSTKKYADYVEYFSKKKNRRFVNK